MARSPGFKLMLAVLVGVSLMVPLLMVYALVWDRQGQSQNAQASIAGGWGGAQVLAGPVLVIPYRAESVETVTENGVQSSRTVVTVRELYLSPLRHRVQSDILPQRLRRSIYESVLFEARQQGEARFALPDDFERYGIPLAALRPEAAELRFGLSDPRGLQPGAQVTVSGRAVSLQPGKGLTATGGAGFFAFVDWDGSAALDVRYRFTTRGSKALTLVPRAGQTEWSTRSTWASPSFGGDFLPVERQVTDSGFSARHAVTNLALGQALVLTEDPGAPTYMATDGSLPSPGARGPVAPGSSPAATISLVEPVDLYSQVDRAIKYGFLFIGFTFLAFLMFDVVGGARVAAAAYLLAGAALVLFFVLLLALAEVIGFLLAYLVAAGAITGLLTAYSAAVLNSWLRARIIGALLAGLYAVLYTLLNLEAYSLLIGSLLLFAALAAVMWATRRIDWSARQGMTGGGDGSAASATSG